MYPKYEWGLKDLAPQIVAFYPIAAILFGLALRLNDFKDPAINSRDKMII